MLHDNVGDRIALMAEAGLVRAHEEAHHDWRLFGRLTFAGPQPPEVTVPDS